MNFFPLFIFFPLGLIIGSFLNVVIYRMNTAKSLGGRSACVSCQNKLRWYELIPIFSFFVLKGRCRTCKTKISIQYPLVELATGLVFAILFLKIQAVTFLVSPGSSDPLAFIFTYIYFAVLFSILVVIAVYDIRHKIIPDKPVFIFGVLSFISMFLFMNGFAGFPVFYPHIPSIVQLLSGIVIALPFALLWLVSRGAWIGLGDAKLAFGLGWLLGLGKAVSGIALSFWIGAIIGVSLVVGSRGYGMKSEIPFAVYLALGAFLAFIFDLHLFAF